MSSKEETSSLTPEEIQAIAARLRSIWEENRKTLGGQNGAVEKMTHIGREEDHFKQSMFSKYLRGERAMNVKSALRFASLLKCSPLEFAPELFEGYYVPEFGINAAALHAGANELQYQTPTINLSDLDPEAAEQTKQHINRLINCLPKLDITDLEYFADIIEHRLNQQDQGCAPSPKKPSALALEMQEMAKKNKTNFF